MTAYYAAHVHDDVVVIKSGPHETSSEAMDTHAQALARGEKVNTGYWEYRVLLDVGSVNVEDEGELHRLLLTDPLLHAIFEAGRQVGR